MLLPVGLLFPLFILLLMPPFAALKLAFAFDGVLPTSFSAVGPLSPFPLKKFAVVGLSAAI